MKCITLSAAVCMTAAALTAAEPLPRCDLVPAWTQSGPSRLYIAENLYDYMDGNSEGYLIYGFKKMRGVTCKSEAASFVVDISFMNDAEAAWGLFASNRDPRLPTENVGIAAQIVPQRGIFVKGAAFIEVSASPASLDHSPAIRAFLKALEPLVDGASTPPAAVAWFPQEGLDPASIRLIPQSLLGISLLKMGYLAKYPYGRAFVVRQPSVEVASQLMQKLRQRFGETPAVALADDAFEANDRYLGRLLIFRKGASLAGYVNLAPETPAVKVAQAFCDAVR